MKPIYKFLIFLAVVGFLVFLIIYIVKANRDIQIVNMTRELDGVTFTVLKGFDKQDFKVLNTDPQKQLTFQNYQIWTNMDAVKGFGATIYTTGSDTPINSFVLDPASVSTMYIGGIP